MIGGEAQAVVRTVVDAGEQFGLDFILNHPLRASRGEAAGRNAKHRPEKGAGVLASEPFVQASAGEGVPRRGALQRGVDQRRATTLQEGAMADTAFGGPLENRHGFGLADEAGELLARPVPVDQEHEA